MQPGQRYGFRVHGPWAPARGPRRTRPSSCSIPTPRRSRARSTGTTTCSTTSSRPARAARPARPTARPTCRRSVVANPFFDWGDDRPPRTPWHETIVYETHVKGLTKRHPEVPDELRGTYAGLAHPAVVEHLKQLGVTAVELMPVHQFVHDQRLVERGLRNYWGYNSIGYLAPHNEYASYGQRGEQVQEFKQMVKTLHRAGHRGDPRRRLQPHRRGQPPRAVLSFKGIDNPAYYRLDPDDRRSLHRLHGHRQHPEHAAPARAAADHGQPALLGQRDARRRLPLRPGRDAGARAARRRPAVGVLRPHPAGSRSSAR